MERSSPTVRNHRENMEKNAREKREAARWAPCLCQLIIHVFCQLIHYIWSPLARFAIIVVSNEY
jgi:hypothetical protein